jgi:SpoVK/Ycf46/Vps4 family AAA+-type ATPase
MATAKQIKALIDSHALGDDSRFYATAMQVAANAARSGHSRLAQQLREAVDDAKARSSAIESIDGAVPTPMAKPRGELEGLLTVSYPKARLTDLALEATTCLRLERVLLEQRQRARIRQYGYAPMRKLLLTGPPGTGKTMTASILAGELGLPLFTIQLHSLITKFMGETAAKLRIIFDALESTRGVYLFDEFDSLGSERKATNDVGEIRRTLNSFLLFLEQDESDSLVVCATNHQQLLDQALFRRFDQAIEFSLPSDAVATRVIRARLSQLQTDEVDWNEVKNALEGLSHADLTRACEYAAKKAILNDQDSVDSDALVEALIERRRRHT